ncbi:MAG: hypothetical protein AAF649_06170 [Verrucomicrobiota bacterium]
MFRISHAGEELDPMTREQVDSMIAAGDLLKDDWVWDEITENWVPLQELFPEYFPSFAATTSKPLDISEEPTEAIPPAAPLAIESFLRQGQRKGIVKAVLKKMDGILEPGERLLHIATQRKPMPDFAPEAFALTSSRLFVFVKGHFKTVYDELPLPTILRPEIKRGWFFTHISMSAGAGIPYGVKFIPKKQGIAFFGQLQNELQRVREAQRNALGVNHYTNDGIDTTPLVTARDGATARQENPDSPPQPEAQEDAHKALHHLEDLKIMLDKGLITQQDYDLKKQKILSQEI